jgi:hypothetical protein
MVTHVQPFEEILFFGFFFQYWVWTPRQALYHLSIPPDSEEPFGETTWLFSHMTVLLYPLTSTVRVFQVFHILTNAGLLQPSWCRWSFIIWICISIMTTDVNSSCAYWLFLCFLWRNVWILCPLFLEGGVGLLTFLLLSYKFFIYSRQNSHVW